MPNTQNPFLGFLNETPEAGYFSFQNQWRSPNMKRFFQSQFSNIQNQYMGELGRQVRSGGEPTLQFTDFLSQFPWQQQFQEGTQPQRAAESSRLNPFTRWVLP